ncbi:hypothetical protein [Parasitella parasitica]|uniref:Uncharacterized protein n=1 Tax=Parasitella parasitica TaxID=35722 RepID=A0A0B7NVF8_9FUNG|nr:hypothetical protein [Parasitella parasitica]
MSLPTNPTPGKDQMSKRIIQDAKVLNYITEAITGTENDYFVGNCEWKNGTRSDVVLQPKSSSMDLPPIIVEIQHTVNKQFMRRAVGYCLQAYSKFDVEPVLLISCSETLSEEIKDDTVDSRLTGIYSYFCKPHCSSHELFINSVLDLYDDGRKIHRRRFRLQNHIRTCPILPLAIADEIIILCTRDCLSDII